MNIDKKYEIGFISVKLSFDFQNKIVSESYELLGLGCCYDSEIVMKV